MKKFYVFLGGLLHLNVSDYKRNLNTRERINKKGNFQMMILTIRGKRNQLTVCCKNCYQVFAIIAYESYTLL